MGLCWCGTRDCIYGQWLHHCMHCTVRSTKLHISRLPPNPALKSKPYPNLSVFTLLYSFYSLHSKIFGIYHPFFLQAKTQKISQKIPQNVQRLCTGENKNFLLLLLLLFTIYMFRWKKLCKDSFLYFSVKKKKVIWKLFLLNIKSMIYF